MDTTVFDRMPPQDLEAERAVLGSMMLDMQCVPAVVAILCADDFLRLSHQRIFASIIRLHREEATAEPTALLADLRKAGDLDEICTIDYIGELFEATFTAANAEHYAKIVKCKGMLRGLINHGMEVARRASDQSDTPENILADAHAKLLAIGTNAMQDNMRPVEESVAQVFEELQNRQSDGASARRVRTGYVDFDTLTGGLHRGELIFIAARPSIGKTCLAVNLSYKIAQERGVAAIYSLEQNRYELTERILCAEASVSTHKVRTGTLDATEVSTLMNAAGRIRGLKIFIDDTPSRTVFQIGMSARRIQAKHGLSLVVIDYLQLLNSEPDERRQNREAQVAALSRGLKQFARAMDVPVLVLAQLNRESEKGTDKRPRLHHLRESGAIEQDADVVMLLSRDTTNDSIVVVDVAKQRNGQTGIVNLTLIKQFLRFENCSTRPSSTTYERDWTNA